MESDNKLNVKTDHALRIGRCYQRELVDWNAIDAGDMYNIGYLGNMTGLLKEAEEMYVRALEGFKKIYGADHPRVLLVASNLSLLTSARN